MFVPILDITKKITDEKGYLTPAWSLLFTQLFNQMQMNISNDGLVIPSLTPDQIAQNSEVSNTHALPNGTLFYDTVNQEVKVKIANVVKTVSTF